MRAIGTMTALAALVLGLAPSVHAQEKVTVIMHFTIEGQHAPWFVAKSKGYFDAAGLDVTIQRGFGSADTVKKVLTGVADIGFADPVYSVDPELNNHAGDRSLALHFWDSIVESRDGGKLLPALASSWKTLDDKTWEFKLRSDIKWQDGTPFTADDIVFSLQRARSVPGSVASSTWVPVRGSGSGRCGAVGDGDALGARS